MAVTRIRVSVARQITELLEHRRATVRLRTVGAPHHVAPEVTRLVKGMEHLSNAYLGLAKEVMKGNVRRAENRAELALAHYGLGLIALSQRDPKALSEIGRELVRLDTVGRHYMNLLLDEPDMYSRIHSSWTALMLDHQTGLGA